jgi:MraZ protein
VTVSAAGRLVIPEEFREFLGVKVPGDCVVVGAGLCIEIWNPPSWHEYLKQETGTFGALFEKLSK